MNARRLKCIKRWRRRLQLRELQTEWQQHPFHVHLRICCNWFSFLSSLRRRLCSSSRSNGLRLSHQVSSSSLATASTRWARPWLIHSTGRVPLTTWAILVDDWRENLRRSTTSSVFSLEIFEKHLSETPGAVIRLPKSRHQRKRRCSIKPKSRKLSVAVAESLRSSPSTVRKVCVACPRSSSTTLHRKNHSPV